MRRDEPTNSEFLKWNMVPSRPLYSQPLVEWAPAATVTYKSIASLLAEKRAEPYPKTIGWLRCTLNFSLI